ncbi:lytic transglycosylase domain-containing protein [Thermocrinis sp.]
MAFLLSSCTPTVRQSVLLKKSNVEVVKRGNFGFSEEEEKFLQQEAKTFDIDVPDREEIRRFVNYFLSNRQNFEMIMRRGSYYIPIIKPILQKYNLPEELALLPVIESAFNPFAVSRAGAAGLWQFIPSTAKRYGLRVDKDVDERFDVMKSTEAAALYLKDLHKMFGNWELALAAYNCGEGCVSRRTGGIDFWMTQGMLPLETRNYVPAFFAVLLLARYPEKYGLNLTPSSLNLVASRIEEETTVEKVIKKTNLKKSVFRDLNPHIRRDRIPSGINVYVPKEQMALQEENTIRFENGAKLITR